jgi:hypothetical protein
MPRSSGVIGTHTGGKNSLMYSSLLQYGSREPNQCGSGSGTWAHFAVTKSWILTWKKYFIKVIPHAVKTYRTYSNKRPEMRIICFVWYPCSWIRIRIPDTDPDPGEQNQCGSGSETLLARCILGPVNRDRSAGPRSGSGFYKSETDPNGSGSASVILFQWRPNLQQSFGRNEG